MHRVYNNGKQFYQKTQLTAITKTRNREGLGASHKITFVLWAREDGKRRCVRMRDLY